MPISKACAVSMFLLATLPAMTRAQNRPCQSVTAATNVNLRAAAQRIVSAPDYDLLRRELSIPVMDTALVAIVAVDSLCEAVTRAEEIGAPTAPWPQSLAVVRFGAFFAAAWPADSRLDAIYLLDERYGKLATLR